MYIPVINDVTVSISKSGSGFYTNYTVSKTQTSYTITGLTKGQSYIVYVTVNGLPGVTSQSSGYVSLMTAGRPILLFINM